MMKNRKIVSRIILAVLLICTVFLIYSIATSPQISYNKRKGFTIS